MSNHTFSQVPKAEIPRSSFDRSHNLKTTFDSGQLIPVFLDEVLPGDTFNLNMSCFARLATPISPFMDSMYLDSFFFFVPLRLVWNNFQKFMGEQEDPGDSTDYITPKLIWTLDAPLTNSIHDYMGLPVGFSDANRPPLAFFHRAYNLIWNEWFRDQNLQNSAVVNKGDGPDEGNDYIIQYRGKRHDYFTSALPWPQKGPAVPLPLGTSAPVIPTDPNTATRKHYVLDNLGATRELGATAAAGVPVKILGAPTTGGDYFFRFATNTGLSADLSDATASTINALREAFQIQRLFERDARGGTRYTEILRSHFGVVSPDARLQRPEYLGGGSTPVNVHPIAQTSSTDATSPQGNLAAMGTASLSGHGFTKSFTEHGVVIGLVSARADLSYQQGQNRMWNRDTRFDYYWPALAHLGEQAIERGEIYFQAYNSGDPTRNTVAWGYQERYAEYRYKPSQITGLFRSNVTAGFQTLDFWHLAQKFDTAPALNGTFIPENPPVDRVIATPTEPHFLFDAYFKLKCARPMPTYSVPGLIDHF